MKKSGTLLINSFVFNAIAIAFCAFASSGCNSILGLEPGTKGDPGEAGAGGDGGRLGVGGGGGGDASCEPGVKEACYDGPEETQSVGACKGGTRTCRSDGTGFEPCQGQVLPVAEVCSPKAPADKNCNGYECSQTIWGRNYGDSGFQFGEQVAADAEGNVVMIGSFNGTMDFGGGSFTSEGNSDVFVAKYTSDGKHRWSKKFGNASNQVGNGIAVDAQGNVLVTGTFDGTIDFGGGPMQTAGADDIFVAKLSPTGDFLWQNKYGDEAKQIGRAITVDADGNIIACGSFLGNIDFGVGALEADGDYDAFVASFDDKGVLRWGKRFGDSKTASCEKVAVTAAGDVLMTGPFKGTVAFGNPALTSAGDDNDSYVAKLNTEGDYIWSVHLGGPSEQRAQDLAVDPGGNVIVAGYLSGSMSVLGTTLSSAGATDIFVIKLSDKGAYVWGNTYGDAVNQFADGVATDAQGNVFVVGSFAGHVNFGGGLLEASGDDSDDMVVAKLDAKGEHIWSRKLGKEMAQYATSVALSPLGDLYVGGYIEGSVDLGGGLITSNGGYDVFLARFEP